MSLLNIFSSKNNNPQQNNAPSEVLLKKRVLVVDDEPSLRQLYVEMLTSEGYEVKEAGNGQEGLVVCASFKPQLILLDLMMPIMNGIAMLQKLRESPEFKDLPVIVLTNAGDVDSMRDAKFFGNARAFLIKANVTPQDILNNVKTLI